MPHSQPRHRLVLGIALLCALSLGGCSPGPEADPRGASRGADSGAAAESRSVTPSAERAEWLIVPGRPGPLTAESSEAELRQRYGDTAVTTTRIQIGEGETVLGTVLYEGDSLRRAEIMWHDTLKLRRPSRVVLRGKQSRWQVGPGISLGTSLQELERVNGRSFTLAGFGWDYGGVITDWEGGALDTALAGIKLYLDPDPSLYESADYSKVLGDRDYSSATPPMQQLQPRVAQVFVDFE